MKLAATLVVVLVSAASFGFQAHQHKKGGHHPAAGAHLPQPHMGAPMPHFNGSKKQTHQTVVAGKHPGIPGKHHRGQNAKERKFLQSLRNYKQSRSKHP